VICITLWGGIKPRTHMRLGRFRIPYRSNLGR